MWRYLWNSNPSSMDKHTASLLGSLVQAVCIKLKCELALPSSTGAMQLIQGRRACNLSGLCQERCGKQYCQHAYRCASAEEACTFLGRAVLFVRPCPLHTRCARNPTCSTARNAIQSVRLQLQPGGNVMNTISLCWNVEHVCHVFRHCLHWHAVKLQRHTSGAAKAPSRPVIPLSNAYAEERRSSGITCSGAVYLSYFTPHTRLSAPQRLRTHAWCLSHCLASPLKSIKAFTSSTYVRMCADSCAL